MSTHEAAPSLGLQPTPPPVVRPSVDFRRQHNLSMNCIFCGIESHQNIGVSQSIRVSQ